MLKSDSWLYLDLQKTGCTFLRDKLANITECSQLMGKKHSVPSNKDLKLPTLLTIRDPSTYYFSLWSYGLDRRGGVWKKSKKHLKKEQIDLLYGEKSVSCFSNFLNYVLEPRTFLTADIKIDLYSYRILRLLVPNKKILCKLAIKLHSERKEKFFERKFKRYLPTVLLPTEHMNLYFHKLSDSGKLDFLHLRPTWKEIFPLDSELKNSSELSRNITASSSNPFLSKEMISKIERKSQLAVWLHKKAINSLR